MLGARSLALAAICVLVGAFASLRPSHASAQTIDLSLNVFYTTPADVNSGGGWQLVAKSSNFGISGLQALISNITTVANLTPTATVNGSDAAGFSVFKDVNHTTYHDIVFGQAPIILGAGEEQGAFYGVGQLANGAPNYPGKPAGSNSEGPAFTSLTSPANIPWATGDAFGDSAWDTAALFASGTFATNTTPAFHESSSGNVFTSLGTSTTFGALTGATVSMIVRTNFISTSADYNHNGIVDAPDYVLWRKTLNQNVTPGSGADGSGNGIIDQADYDLWRSHFGNPFGAGSGSLSSSVVPEPTGGLLVAIGAVLLCCGATGRAFARWERVRVSARCRGFDRVCFVPLSVPDQRVAPNPTCEK